MLVARTLPELRKCCVTLTRDKGNLCLVPTMGALHDGHLALIATAHQQANAAIVASIYVNPTQFAAHEDIGRYPRQEATDLETLCQAGCDLAWLPDTPTMYPPTDATFVEVGGPARLWEGAHRPGHFRGVATVVAKLIGQVGAKRAFFGEKDWQQLQVVRRMVTDLHLPIEIVAVPTVRAADGLALSSRNVYLSAEHRKMAPALYSSLVSASTALRDQHTPSDVCTQARHALGQAGFSVDYFNVVDPASLEPLDHFDGPARLIAAARLGGVRLLDNMAVTK
jgi:pantoate--beta-alanine ligase